MLKNDFYGKEITTMMILHSKLFSADKIFCGIFVILTSILLRHYFIQTPIPNTPIANFKSFNDVLQGDHDCLFYNQIRPINSGQFPEYEDVTPRQMVNSKYLFHGSVRWANNVREWQSRLLDNINEFPQFLFSGRQVVGSETIDRALVYQHWTTFKFIANYSNFISIDNLHMCQYILLFFPLEEYDPNIAETHKFFTKTYLPNYGVPLVQNTVSYPMILKCAELDGSDEGVQVVMNDDEALQWKKKTLCLDWIQQKYIPPNPFSTADVNFYIHANKSYSFIGVSPEIYLEVGSINSKADNTFWLSHFEGIIKSITSHITRVSNYSGFVCFDAVRDDYGQWLVVDINVRLCGGHHHFMIANIMLDRHYNFWQYLDYLPTRQGITCEILMQRMEQKNKQSICKALITSVVTRNDHCVSRFMLFGTSLKNLPECFPSGIFNWSRFDPWHLRITSDNRMMNDMMPIYLLKDF